MDAKTIVYCALAVGLVIGFLYLKHQAKLAAIAKRRAYLFEKYRDMEIVENIMNGLIWQCMTDEQLLDSWGAPEKIDTKIYKTKTKMTYKYVPIGRRQYAQRVIVENGEVVGWDSKTL